MPERGSGILLHIASLPSPYGIGDLGPWAYRFVDILVEAGQKYWQILSLIPTDPGRGNSPYDGPSLFAGNHLLISPDLLVEAGYVEDREVLDHPCFPAGWVDYGEVWRWKYSLLDRAFVRCRPWIEGDDGFVNFSRENASWLEDCALFMGLKRALGGGSWTAWPEGIRERQGLQEWRGRLAEDVLREMFYQYLFFQQWQSLPAYCRDRGWW